MFAFVGKIYLNAEMLCYLKFDVCRQSSTEKESSTSDVFQLQKQTVGLCPFRCATCDS